MKTVFVDVVHFVMMLENSWGSFGDFEGHETCC